MRIEKIRIWSRKWWKTACIIPLIALLIIPFLFTKLVWAQTIVTVSGQGGKVSQAVPDGGGPFELNLPLNKNAVNNISITAVDRFGNKASKEISVTQVSLDSVVVSKVTAERLSVERVEQLVAEGVIKLDNPENYHVSQFNIVLTIAKEPVPISVPIAIPKEEKTGWEILRLPRDDLGWGPKNLPEDKTEIIVFEQKIEMPQQQTISIPGVIIIEGRIKSLKEFFSVRLLLINTSGIFTLKDV